MMKKLLSNGLIKAVAIGLFVLSVITFVVTTFAIVALAEFDAYKKDADFEKQRNLLYSDHALRYAYSVVDRYAQENELYEDVDTYYLHGYYPEAENGDGMNFDYELFGAGADPLSHTKKSNANGKYCFQNTYEISYVYGEKKIAEVSVQYEEGQWPSRIQEVMDQYGVGDYSYRELEGYYDAESETYVRRVILYKDCSLRYNVKISLYENPLVTDAFSMERDLLETGYNLRYMAVALCVLSFILALVLFVYLMAAAGHRRNADEIVLNPVDKIPYDLFTLLVGGLFTIFAVLIVWTFQKFDWNLVVIPLVSGFSSVFGMLLLTLWFLSTATRFKVGKWWKNTLIAKCLGGIFKAIAFLIRSTPLIWKSILFLLGVGFLNLLAFIAIGDSPYQEFGIMLWLFDWFLITAIVIGCSIAYRYLSKGASKIAQGRTDAKIDTTNLLFDFKTMGENLNHIGDGIRCAVDEQMKSERMKTELITNVSHDIKTPLTSIINYVDLLEREGAVNAEGLVYLEVLSRQSARLKKLIEDLIHLSKASTGNLETHMLPTDSVVLAEQIVGEYGDRLESAGLEMICHVETEQATILADGQLLYRVFDNLLGNICKYAQPGTRVYLDVTEVAGDLASENAGKIRFLFRNISASPLHISPDELTERFVRGDASRNTEGSGLGLSIVKSLTELQGGTFEIAIDGDLFKAILQFNRTNFDLME